MYCITLYMFLFLRGMGTLIVT